MTREVDRILTKYTRRTGGHLEKVKQELSDAGVVIKTNREFPKCPNQPADDNRLEDNFIKREAWVGCRNQFDGYTAYETLI